MTHIDYKGKNLTVIILIDMILFIEYHKKSWGEKLLGQIWKAGL